jgi:C-terminal binding protein
MLTVLEPEPLYPDTLLEQPVMGDSVPILQGNAKKALIELPDELCAQADGLMTPRLAVPKEALQKFPKLKRVIRTGVGYDRVDRPA